jgi:hypothetical protein
MEKDYFGNKYCFVCGYTQGLHRHHIYGGRNRKISEKQGFVVYLCGYHHNLSDKGVHFDSELDLKIKAQAQRIFEKEHTREEFMELIGRSYL